MTAIPLFRSTATPTRDMAPLVGTDAEYMRFLRLRRERQTDRADGTPFHQPRRDDEPRLPLENRK